MGRLSSLYVLAHEIKVSGPIAVVTAALVIGNSQRNAWGERASRIQLESFWELINELLNAALFVWIGLAVISLSFNQHLLLMGMIAIPVSLLGRLLSIWASLRAFGLHQGFTNRAYSLMTWGGIRGGVSVALALSLPATLPTAPLISITYVVVVFSILVQGLTVGFFVRGK